MCHLFGCYVDVSVYYIEKPESWLVIKHIWAKIINLRKGLFDLAFVWITLESLISDKRFLVNIYVNNCIYCTYTEGVINKYTAHSIFTKSLLGFGIVFLHPSPKVKKILTVALKECKKKKKLISHKNLFYKVTNTFLISTCLMPIRINSFCRF